MQAADIAVQIDNYKTKAFLRPLVMSVLRDISESGLEAEINILDNASGDDLTAIGNEFGTNNIHVYQSKTNVGFGAGHNILAAKTTARYLLILNPDTLFIEPHTIERLIETMKQTGATVVGPKLLTPRPHVRTPQDGFSVGQLHQQRWDHGAFTVFSSFHPLQETSEVGWVCGAVFLIRRQEFNDIGCFDEQFFLYYEEVDLCFRLHKHGEVTVYEPAVQVVHYGSISTKSPVFNRYIVRSFFRFHRKRLGA